MLRTFLAYDITPEQIEKFAQIITAGREVYPREIKWVEPENLHFTYLFLGDIHPTDQQVVSDILQSNADKMPIVTINDGQLRWNSLHSPRVVWIEYKLDSRDFLKFRKKIIYELTQSLPYLEIENRDFRCHLTLGRVRSDFIGKIDITKWSLSETLTDEIILDQLSFYQSTLTPQGPKYTLIIHNS